MRQAIERIGKTMGSYASGNLSRSLAMIELVSAFKVALKESPVEASRREDSISSYIDALLTRIDGNRISAEMAAGELGRAYEAACSKNPEILNYMSDYQGGPAEP